MPSTNRNACINPYVRTLFWANMLYEYHVKYGNFQGSLNISIILTLLLKKGFFWSDQDSGYPGGGSGFGVSRRWIWIWGFTGGGSVFGVSRRWIQIIGVFPIVDPDSSFPGGWSGLGVSRRWIRIRGFPEVDPDSGFPGGGSAYGFSRRWIRVRGCPEVDPDSGFPGSGSGFRFYRRWIRFRGFPEVGLDSGFTGGRILFRVCVWKRDWMTDWGRTKIFIEEHRSLNRNSGNSVLLDPNCKLDEVFLYKNISQFF